ncbi:MAG: hypothetical protein ACREPM_01600, partial [Gemmatimonadaceae bacterium]
MPVKYLVGKDFAVPIEPSDTYAGRWKVMGKSLFIDPGAVSVQPNPPAHMPRGGEAYQIRDEALFHDFLKSWMDNSLALYRGFPGCHFCWPELLNGTIQSEGQADTPGFTMGNTGGNATRWLPTADKALAEGVSLQCCDQFTRALSTGRHVPIGFAVKIFAGSARNLPTCWLNAGEIVVRGPLMGQQYAFVTIYWMRDGNPYTRPWPQGFGNLTLPPQRPFQPATQNVVDAWWNGQAMTNWIALAQAANAWV